MAINQSGHLFLLLFFKCIFVSTSNKKKKVGRYNRVMVPEDPLKKIFLLLGLLRR